MGNSSSSGSDNRGNGGAGGGSGGDAGGKVCARCQAVGTFRQRTICRNCVNAERRESRSGTQKAPILDTAPQARVELPLEPILLIPDCHIPNHDVRAWGLMLRVAMHLKPKHVVILGDFADGETLSAHPATKPGELSFEQEVAGISACLDQLDALGATNKIYVEGNHEFRLDRYLMERAPQMFYSIKWQNILNLHKRAWQWVPYRKSVAIGKLHITHDTGTAGINAHRTSAQAFGGSAVIGHTHRMAYEVKGRFDGTPYLAAMLGWLGDAEKAASYMHEAKASDWVHGFGVGYLEPQSGIVHLQPVPIVHGRCVVNGRLFT
jgi:predicted phosphodiesterase